VPVQNDAHHGHLADHQTGREIGARDRLGRDATLDAGYGR
jgi:hypothetical protein